MVLTIIGSCHPQSHW